MDDPIPDDPEPSDVSPDPLRITTLLDEVVKRITAKLLSQCTDPPSNSRYK